MTVMKIFYKNLNEMNSVLMMNDLKNSNEMNLVLKDVALKKNLMNVKMSALSLAAQKTLLCVVI